MSHFKELDEGQLMIKKFYSLFSSVNDRLEKAYKTCRTFSQRANKDSYAQGIVDAANMVPAMTARPQVKRLRHAVYKDIRNFLSHDPNTRTKNSSNLRNTQSSKKEVAYYSGIKNLFYSKRRINLIKKIDKNEEINASNLVQAKKKDVLKPIINIKAVSGKDFKLGMSAIQEVTRTIRDKSVDLKKRGQLNCFFIKHLDARLHRRAPLVDKI